MYFKLYSFTLLKQSHSLIVLHSYLCIWLNCCSIISQVIIYLNVLKRWISNLNLALFCSTLPAAPLVVDWSPSLLFIDLVSLAPRVALLVVVLSPSQFSMLCVAQHLELLYSFLTCLRLTLCCFGLLCTSSRSPRC